MDGNLVIESTCIRAQFNFFEDYIYYIKESNRMVVYEIGKDIEHLVVRLFLYRSSLKYHHYLGDDLFV